MILKFPAQSDFGPEVFDVVADVVSVRPDRPAESTGGSRVVDSNGREYISPATLGAFAAAMGATDLA